MSRLFGWFAMRMSWLVATWHGFLIRCFFILVTLNIIFNYKFSCVKKYDFPMVYSELPLARRLFSCGDWSIAKHCGSFSIV